MTSEGNTHLYSIKVADRVSAMLAYWDKNQICRFANAAYIDWFGKTREDMVDKITIKELLGPDLYEKNLPFISAALKGHTQTFERDVPLPTGGTRPSLANYYPDIVDGEVVGFFVHVADVSHLKNLEKELIKSNEIINIQNKRLLNFSNIVSHNLKSYSINLAALLDLHEKATSEEDKNKSLIFLKSISKAFSSTISHLNEIVKSQNQAEIKPVRINLSDFINSSIETLRIQISSSNAIIKNKVDPDVKLLINPAYMESILLNFLTNSIKYSHPERTPIIELDSFKRGHFTALRIKDNGKGINLDKHGSDLFGMYKTFHGNRDAQGIGLFITKYQIEAMGGKIEVESRVDHGTTFIVYFHSYKG